MQADGNATVIAYLNRLVHQRSASSDAAAAAARDADPAPRARPDREKPRIATSKKSTCKTCGRDVRMVTIEQSDGSFELVEMDPEVMTGAEYPRGKKRLHFQRNHAEKCATYVLDNEKKSKRDRWLRQMNG